MSKEAFSPTPEPEPEAQEPLLPAPEEKQEPLAFAPEESPDAQPAPHTGRITRRQFLTGLGITLGSAALGGIAADIIAHDEPGLFGIKKKNQAPSPTAQPPLKPSPTNEPTEPGDTPNLAAKEQSVDTTKVRRDSAEKAFTDDRIYSPGSGIEALPYGVPLGFIADPNNPGQMLVTTNLDDPGILIAKFQGRHLGDKKVTVGSSPKRLIECGSYIGNPLGAPAFTLIAGIDQTVSLVYSSDSLIEGETSEAKPTVQGDENTILPPLNSDGPDHAVIIDMYPNVDALVAFFENGQVIPEVEAAGKRLKVGESAARAAIAAIRYGGATPKCMAEKLSTLTTISPRDVFMTDQITLGYRQALYPALLIFGSSSNEPGYITVFGKKVIVTPQEK